MKKAFKASDAQSICDVLRNKDSIFKIPQFQRAYTWKSKNIDDLWTSLIENDEGYFIGNMVWLESEDYYQIIDGQQRIITISLMLIALKDLWKELLANCVDENTKEAINRIVNHQIDDSIFYYGGNAQNPILRIQPYKSNINEIYKEIASSKTIEEKIKLKNINGNKIDDSQRIFIKNYKYIIDLIRKEINKKSKNEPAFKILDTITTKVSGLYFISIKCETDVDAYKIFEGLNNTGISLSAVDLVKNAVMYSVKGEEEKKKIEKEWQSLEYLFENTNIGIFNKYLRHHWIATVDYVNSAKLFKEIKENKLEDKSAKEIFGYVNNLNIGAGLYLGFRNENWQFFRLKDALSQKISGFDLKETLSILSRFNYLNVEQAYEVLLALTYKFLEKGSRLRYKNYLKIINDLWIFLFRSGFVSINPSEYENKFSDLCREITNKKDGDYKKIHMYMYNTLSGMIQGKDKDKDFIETFTNSNKLTYEKTGDNRLINYILHTIITSEKHTILMKNPTVEHILPQNPKHVLANISQKEYEIIIGNIGNLTCLDGRENTSIGNSDLEKKCEKIFAKDPFPLNQAVNNNIELWLKEPQKAIKLRAEKYAEMANNIWRMSF
jgi:uncharacterized protein with ParB-like and HNH nuclease domain